MNPKIDVTNIANQDWSNFDFTRWNLEGLNLDTQSATLAGRLRDVTLSPQGPQNFAAGLVTVKAAALQDLQDHATVIQGRIAAMDGELTARLDATRKQIAAIEENIRIAAVPVVATPDPESFQVAAKVLDQATRLGLPGLQVRLYDTHSPKVTLASETTDPNGNALLKLNRKRTQSLAKSNAEIAIEVLTSAHTVVFSGPAPAPKLNQTGAVLAPLSVSTDLIPHLNAASAAMAQQEGLLSAVTAKVTDLQTHYQQIKVDLQQQLQEVQGIIADLQGTSP
jgi:hypothetical protein